MPSDLDQLAQDTAHQDKWSAPPTNRGLQNLADQQSMTHQPEQPNPAAPYLQAARDWGQRAFVDPLKATGFLPQEQTPPWYEQARETGGQLFRQGPMPMIAGMFPRGGLAQVASNAGLIPPWMNDNVLTHALRSPAFTQATQFFTPLIGTLTLARAPNRSPVLGNDQYTLINKETGEKRGDVWLTYDDARKHLEVGYMQAATKPGTPLSVRSGPGDARRWGLGRNPVEAALELRSALPEAFRFYPDMKTVSFTSVGGTRGAQGISADLEYAVNKTPEGVEWKRIKHDPDLFGRVRPGAPLPPLSPQRFPIPTQSFPPGTGPAAFDPDWPPAEPPPSRSSELMNYLLRQMRNR